MFVYGGSASFQECSFNGNTAAGLGSPRGGAVCVSIDASASFQECSFSGNSASQDVSSFLY